MMSAPSEILCRLMPATYIARKVTASTSGMVSATTSPGRMSIVNFHEPGFRCRPRLTNEIASTIAIASISTRTNSLTELFTARGWSATLKISMPTGSAASSRCCVCARSLPSWMMSPPLAIDTPSPITSRPTAPSPFSGRPARIFSRGGSV
jgi:hypothetical protein